MKKVLFVDDEQMVLDGLRRTLRSLRHEWQMDFQTSGRDALAAIEAEAYDIVVADMNMPGMDGAELLERVKQCHPETVRLILSGSSEQASVLKSVGPTHQFLSKPCEAEELKSTITRVVSLQNLLDDSTLGELVRQISDLPSMPDLYKQIVAALQDPNVSLTKVGEIISSDIATSLKILQMVNSGFFSLSKPISNIGHAVAYLGIEIISALVLGASVFSDYEQTKLPGFSLETLWHHSMRTASFAKTVALEESFEKLAVDDSFIGGMLHDVGKLVLASSLPDRYGRVLKRVADDGMPLSKAEREEFGASHAEIGAYLIGLWGLPFSVVAAVAYHGEPGQASGEGMEPLTAVHVGNILVRGNGQADLEAADIQYLAKLGLQDRWPVWHNACQDLAGKEGEGE